MGGLPAISKQQLVDSLSLAPPQPNPNTTDAALHDGGVR
jgi:hypothetical protein